MFFLRLLAIFNGGVVLIAAPLYLRSQGTLRGEDMETVVGGCVLLAAIAASFFFVGLFGHRMRRSVTLRTVGGLLLAVPLVTGVAMVAETRYLQAVYLCVMMFCMAAVLFVSFVYPGSQVRKHRPMRPRDASERVLELPGRR
jgi:Ca2+/Na+ antiporter